MRVQTARGAACNHPGVVSTAVAEALALCDAMGRVTKEETADIRGPASRILRTLQSHGKGKAREGISIEI